MFEQIEGKNVLITGASGGIGASISRLFFRNGAHIGLHYNKNEESINALESQLHKDAQKVKKYRGNLLNMSDLKILMESFLSDFQGIDILINNAGACFEYQHFEELEEWAWDDTYSLNSKAAFYLAKIAFSYMKMQRWGRIINISTNGTRYFGAHNLHYVSAKASLDIVSKGLAKEGAKYGILVNSIKCGLIDTPMRESLEGYDSNRFNERVKMVPLGKPGQPEDIGMMALYLSSEYGNFITGQDIVISGGE